MPSLFYSGAAPLVLASRSPRRRELLARLGLEFTVEPADIDEIHPPGLSPREAAEHVAAAKARTVAAARRDGLVIGADTIVILDGEVLGKPEDAAAACRMLARLTGRTHEVVTGVCLVDAAGGRWRCGSEGTRVTMRAASDAEIRAYVASGEPLDKAGAYGAQDLGAFLVERVEGCFYNVVGLPLARLYTMLREFDGSRTGAGAASERRGA
ncbi:MAG: Maf family protein [Candidatus Eiseniibacteriota bacterium]|jgi:septum formation protein